MKKLVPAYVISFVLCFMLFIYEPLLMYSSNIDDFWFDIHTLIVAMVPAFVFSFSVITFIFTCIYYFNNSFFKKKPIYEILLIIFIIAFLATYIQGNYLSGNLPVLTGDKINWNDYLVDNIITGVVWVALIGIFIFCVKKYKYEKAIKTSMYVSLVIFVMLVTSLIPSLLAGDALINKPMKDVTLDNINKSSSNKNFYIFLVDAVDSTTFSKVLMNSEYKDMLDDFTYYPDTLAAYPFTRDSIPFILSGIWNENETPFLRYYQDAINESVLLSRLSEENYNINIYEPDSIVSVDYKWNISNLRTSVKSDKRMCLIKQQGRYILFKYLPYFAKKYSKIDDLDFYYCRRESNADVYSWADLDVYKNIKYNKIETTPEKMFKFIHIEGAHTPFDLDENMNFLEKEDGSYEQKIVASIKIIDAYLKRLKEYGVYDNSVIIVMADHGYDVVGSIEGRMNPILYIKGLNEKHDLVVSNSPISYVDLNDAYIDLLDGKKSTDLFKNIDSKRIRRYIWYSYGKEDKMIEYEQTGKAIEVDKMVKTGKVFNR